MSLKRKLSWILLICVLYVILSTCTIATYAYFSKKEIYDGYLSGQVELLFDRLNDAGVTAYGKALKEDGETVEVSKGADWGTKEYPFVISNVRHLYNLSELQRLGYFDKKFISKNTAGNYDKIPYFLVCEPDYTPVAIDGSNFKNITAIGTDQYPFIGSVKGVKNTDANQQAIVNGKSCDTSAICNVKVAGNPANVDVGLFGYIGYLGDEASAQNGAFTGQISTISNLVLSDVQVVVQSSAWDAVTAFVEDIMLNAAGHRYSFSELHGTEDYNKVPHENHHIGILAGHASYANIEFVSVYYSADDKIAMDLSDATVVDGTKANYLSATGILGFIYNLNPEVTVDAGKLVITAGSGDSLGDISYGSVGGGGSASGNKAGYVLASEMYNKYCYTGTVGNLTQDTDGTIILKDALAENGNALCVEWVRDRILWGTQRTGRYYFYDGVFTFALSSTEDIIEPTWDVLLDDQGNPIGQDGNPLPEGASPVYDIPDFSIGQDDDAKWQTNTSKGNKAIVAYVQKVKSDQALQDAIADGKQIFIMKENAEDLFLMSLYNQSTAGSGDFEQKYTTNGTTQKFGSDRLVQGLIDSYNGGGLSLPTDMTSDFDSTEKLTAALADGTLRPINVGITSTNVTLDILRQQYKITPSTTGSYAFFAGDTPVGVNSDGTIQQYYDYANAQDTNGNSYGGYIYYTAIRSDTTTIDYEYWWQSADGKSTKIGTGKDITISSLRDENLPEDVFSATGATWEGENIYSCTFNGTTYTGVVVNKSEGTFYGTGNTANANGATLTKPTAGTSSIYYFYNDVRTNDDNLKKYTHSSGGNEYSRAELADTGRKSPSGKPIYSVDGKEGVLLDRYSTFTFSAQDQNGKTNFLRMVEAKFSTPILGFNISFGTHYALWNGNDDAANTPSNFSHNFLGNINPTVTNSTAATVRFADDGTCYIQYSIGYTGLYVNSTGLVFNTAASSGEDGTKLCIYTVEGAQDINYGRITFDPIDDPASDTDSRTFSAGTHVLFANPTHTRQNGETGNITATSTGYTVTSLEELNWNNGFGNTLSQTDLLSKFKMLKGITFGASFNLFNGTLGTSGIITAPVGTEGFEANIPQSCIAFRINKPIEAAKIRVIVSVAVSEYYPGEKENNVVKYDLGDYTRYFNLWKMEQAGESILQIFNATGSNLMDRFEVPRSHPYQPGTTTADNTSESGVKNPKQNPEYIMVDYNGNPYRCYLNGDRVLVAYEFTVNTTTTGTGVGVYCLGMSGIDSNGDVVGDVPMEIVYFSADGVASAGRDGATGSQIGTIDFVYDHTDSTTNQSKIVTVTESSSTDASGNEDYSTYYPSYCLLYFYNTEHADGYTDENPVYLPVNNEKVVIRRHVVAEDPSSDANHNTTPSRSTLTFKLTGGDKRVRVVQYSRVADNVQEIT